MRPQDVRLPPELAERLALRAAELLPLGSLSTDRREASEAERGAVAELAERLNNTYPYPDAHYAGQMLKPPHALAWAAYATTMLLNPNNHALDGGPATARMEREAVAELAEMFGLEPHLGHLTASGTIANLEALWAARELAPDAVIVSGANAHYTHARMAAVIGARHETVAQDELGRLDLEALDGRLGAGDVGTVVATWGRPRSAPWTTSRQSPPCAPEYGVRLHVDAAYGGFFALVAGDPGRGAGRAVRRGRSRRLDRARSPQARPAALRLRLCAVRRPGRGAAVRPRLAVHVLHL